MTPVRDKAARQDAIRRIIRGTSVATQEELGELLGREGYDVTQATLSRDLAQIGAMRVSLPEGGTVYALEATPPPTPEGRLRELGAMVTDLDENGSLVVVHTTPGMASAIALALDQARLEEWLGSIAGDDTIFIAPARGVRTVALVKRLRVLLGKEGIS